VTEPSPTLTAEATEHRLREHLSDPLYRTGYFLIAGSGATSVLGFVFWSVAAHAYSARVVGLNSAVLSAMTLLSGACQLGLNTVLVRYVPVAGERTRALVMWSYVITASLSLILGAVVAIASPVWSPKLGFLAHQAGWLAGFAVATACFTVFSLQDAVMTGLQSAQWVPLENTLYATAKLVILVAISGAVTLAGPFLAWNVPAAIAVALISVLIFRRLIPAARRPAVSEGLDRRSVVGTAAGNFAASVLSMGVIYLVPVIVADEKGGSTTAYFYAPWLIATALLLLAGNTSASMTVEAALDAARLRQLFRRTASHTLALVVVLVAVVELAAPVILSLFGSRYSHAGSSLLRLLALGALPNAFIALGLAVARVQERGTVLIAIQAGEFVPLVALTLLLLPSHGLTSVGVAFLASQSAVALVLLATVLRPFLRGSRGIGT
jgi:O-antigen/teichoic acid export membrane protein